MLPRDVGSDPEAWDAASVPELPEVETTRRHVAQALTGRRIDVVEIRRDRMARRNERPADIVERLVGRTVESVGRIGKFIVIEVEGDLRWVIHLGMSGRLQLAGASHPEAPHTNVVVSLDDGVELRFVDPRTFGFVAVWTAEEWAASTMPAIGRDALSDTPDAVWLADRLAGRTAPIKALLLDQRVMAGIGNIYADEVLHRCGVRPTRPAGSLTSGEVEGLASVVGPVLEDGLLHGGTSLDDLAYLLPDGRAGEYAARLRVYGRTGEPCRTCGTPIERTIVAQRSSHFCPRCQT